MSSEKQRSASQRWREANPEKDKAATDAWRAKNRPKLVEQSRQWRINNPEKYASLSESTMQRRKSDPTYKHKKARWALNTLERLAGRPRPESCEVCGKPPVDSKSLSFDHCHVSGLFRGWLCHYCNVVLGMAHDDPIVLRKLADYVEQHNVLRGLNWLQ